MASFLHRVLVAPNVRVMAAANLAEALEDELYALRQQLGDKGETAFPKPALDYLNDWAAPDKGWRRKFYKPGTDEAQFDLTPATEKAIAWLVQLSERQFVGTESRLLTLFDLLKQMSEGPDITLDADSFSRLRLPVRRVFITENETNFLAFPHVREAIVIFGAGYGWEALARGRWLNDCTVYYWGDIDTHGFAILNQLRGQFAHVVSFLMDRETRNAHTAIWGVEDKPSLVDLPRLTADERALYDDLRSNRIRKGLRLEQEQIGFGGVSHRLQELLRDAERTRQSSLP